MLLALSGLYLWTPELCVTRACLSQSFLCAQWLETFGDQLNTANIAILGINTEISAIKGDIKEVKDRQILMYDQMSKVVVNSAEMQNKIEDNEQKLARKADIKEVIEHNEIMQDSINILYALSKVNDKQHVEYDKKLNLRRA